MKKRPDIHINVSILLDLNHQRSDSTYDTDEAFLRYCFQIRVAMSDGQLRQDVGARGSQ